MSGRVGWQPLSTSEKRMKANIVVGFAVAFGCVIAALMVVKLQQADMAAFERAIDPARQPAPPVVKPTAQEPLPQTPVVASTNAPQTPPAESSVQTKTLEDLNENGFSDGDGSRATVDDLPLIENRLLLIEQLTPGAMDEVNAAAFMEAYKDLVNMWVRLTRS
jgi:hypothetical protein